MVTKSLFIFIKPLLTVFLVNILFFLAYTVFSQSGSELNDSEILAKGEKLFKKNCSGCHVKGQNVIKPEKPIIGSKKLKKKESFKEFIEAPPPPMPKFKNITSKPEELDALYKYVSSLKKEE